MISNKFSLTWQDAGKALLLTIITSLLATLGQAIYEAALAGDWAHLIPTKEQILIALKAAVTAGVAYLGKNYFTDTVASAQKTIDIAAVKADTKSRDTQIPQ